jgi:N-acetylglucosaminyl-diphospho-decaprenol L-rhamnosyltransferase
MNNVAVILVGLNANRFVRECIESVYRAGWKPYSFEIIYVDNGSTDGSIDMVRENFPEVKRIANTSNLGYCKAANQGAAIANSRHFFFLNDDTYIDDDAMPFIIEFLDTHPNVGVVGSRILNLDRTDQWSGRRFPSVWNGIFGRRSKLSKLFPSAKPLADYLYHDEIASGAPFEAEWVSAAAMLVRRESFAAVGGYAEDYYYWHEAVFCDRIKRIGQKVYLDPRSKIVHYEGKGSGPRPYRVKRWHIIDFHRGAYRCYCQHYNRGRLHPARWMTAAALGVRAGLLLVGAKLVSPK